LHYQRLRHRTVTEYVYSVRQVTVANIYEDSESDSFSHLRLHAPLERVRHTETRGLHAPSYTHHV